MKLKGKWMPGAKKEEAREADKSELLRVMGLLSREPVKCSKVGCGKIADVIIDRFPFCAEHGIEYQQIKKPN